MITHALTYFRDILHAQLCYQLFITPLNFPLEKKYRDHASLACEYIESRRSEMIHHNTPRHYVIHRFESKHPKNQDKKILITHGWMSRAAYMVHLIHSLRQQGYDVYALDFPAHGDAKGIQLTWIDAVAIIRQAINQHGPFYGVLGHSFGGSMLLSTLNLAGQFNDWALKYLPQRVVLLASPTRMRSPVSSLARRLKLSAHGYLYLHQLLRQGSLDPAQIHLRHFISQMPKTPFLCIHGEQDLTVYPKESIGFCNEYHHAQLALLPDADHISILKDQRVEHMISNFLT